MGTIQLNQLAMNISGTVGPHIDVSDVKGSDVETVRLSRGLAAWTLMRSCQLTPEIAASSVTDGFGDQGIDAAWVDSPSKTIFLVQSKWSVKGTGSIAAGDMHKFLQGVRHFVNAEFSLFNSKFQSRRESFESALEDLDVRVKLVVAHSGADTESAAVAEAVKTLTNEMNDPIETVTYDYLSQKELHAQLRTAVGGQRPNIEATLYDWGTVEEPYRAFYGQVDASEVAGWYHEHGTQILADNIRQFLGDSDVNQSISDTLIDSPEQFWYLNNGITALCDNYTKAAGQGTAKKTGKFGFNGVSIVNGAQTVGCLAGVSAEHPEKVADARVTVRFISLEGCPPGFAQDVTRGTNTQNRVERRDFVSLDPIQERLAAELNLEGVRYAIKSGAENPDPAKGFTVTEATVALACADSDTDYSTQAKREVGRLWMGAENPSPSSQYRHLFHDKLTPQRLWRAVRILRGVDAQLSIDRAQLDGRPSLVGVHGNRLVAHLVFSRLGTTWPYTDEDDFSLIMEKVAEVTSDAYAEIVQLVDENFEGNYLASLFKNASKCRDIAQKVAKQESGKA